MADWTPIDMSRVPSFLEQLAMSQGIELPPEPPAQDQQQQRDALDPPIPPLPQEHSESIDFGAPRVSTRSVSRTPLPPNDPKAEDDFLYSNDSNRRNSTGRSRRYYDYDLVDTTAAPVIAPRYVKPSTSTDNEIEVLDVKKAPSPEPERPCLPLIDDTEEGKLPPAPEVTKEISPSSPNEQDCEPPSTIPGFGSPPPPSSPEPYNESSVNALEFEQEQSPTPGKNNDTHDEDSSQHDREVKSEVPPSNGNDTLDANTSSKTIESQEQEPSSNSSTESEVETGVVQNEKEQNQISEPYTTSQSIHLSTPTSPMEFPSTKIVEEEPTESLQADESPTVVTRTNNKRSSHVEHQTSPLTASTSSVPPVKIKLVSVGNEFKVQNATSTSSNPTRNVKLDELAKTVENRMEGAQKRLMKKVINDKKQQEKGADKADRNKPKDNNDKVAQPQLSTQGKLCKNCKKTAVVDATWDEDYCSESCVVIHVKNVFQRFTEHLKKVNMSSSSLTKSTNSKNASSGSIQRQLTNLMSLVTPSATTSKEEPKTSNSSPATNQS